jgi:molybdopterin converting factor small subunit
LTINHRQKMTIQVYAILKDYFDTSFTVDKTVNNIEALNNIMIERNPSAAAILAGCRYAVNDTFVDNLFQLQPNDNIHIIPPSSGG